MPVYTVHQPPRRRREVEDDPARFAFVRDGLYFWAFLLTPLWMARYRLWLVLVLYVIFAALLGVALHFAGVSFGTRVLVSFFIALLIGFEAGSLRRWTLNRRGWANVGLVVADDVESAERRFFDSWTRHGAPPAAFARPNVSVQSPRSTDVLGLFPEPGARA